MTVSILLLVLIIVGSPVWGAVLWYIGNTESSRIGGFDPAEHLPRALLAFNVFLATLLILLLERSVPLDVHPTDLPLIFLGAVMFVVDSKVTRLASGTSSTDQGGSGASVAVALAGSVPEELVYRWGIHAILAGLHPALFVAVSSLTFGLHHYPPNRSLEALLKTGNGMVYAALLLWSGSITIPILCHLLYNITHGVLTGVQ